MKKFLFLATVVGAAFTSCVNDNEAVLTPEENPQPITFEVAKYKASSRAEGDNKSQNTGHTAFPTNQFFGTFAYEAGSINGEHKTFMDDVKVGYVNNAWIALGKTYMWPEKGHVDFISYYPYSELNGGFTPEVGDINSGDKNKLSFNNYTVNQVDLMYSDKAHLQTHNYTTYYHSGVPTLFRHALAKLNFHVAAKYLVGNESDVQTSWEILVTSIKLNSLCGQGTLHLQTTSPSQAGTTQWTIMNQQEGEAKVWLPEGQYNVEKEWTVAAGQPLDTKLAVFANAADFYVLPQTFGNKKQSVTISYQIINNTPGAADQGTPQPREKTLYFYDYSKMVSAWEMGKNITYNIIIDPQGDIINFDPAVSDWETVSGTLDI